MALLESEELGRSMLDRLNPLHNFRTERLGQRAVQVIGDVCFGFFVVSVLVFTVIAILYKPPDPWFQEQRAYNRHFNSVGNSTLFHPDDSVLITGEDDAAGVISQLPPAINPEGDPATPLGGSCNTSARWSCGDPGVKLAVEKMNAHHFPELVFYSYRIVPGGKDVSECDVAWEYRPLNITTPRMYTDYRRYSLVRNPDCTFEVKKIGKWHSGVHARVKRKIAPSGDRMPPLQQRKYLYYTRVGEDCKSMGEYTWGLLCALAEARYLNRTFVLDLEICPGKDFRFYFDLQHLKNESSIIEKEQLSKSLTERHVDVEPVLLRDDAHSVLYRESSWHRVCEGQAATYLQRPWGVLWKSKLLMNIVNAICNKLEWDFDVVHVIRGYKAENKKLWPHLDRDTSPESLIAKLTSMIGFRRKVFIATNEPFLHYFDRLREQFEIHLLSDYGHLWAENSEWWNETVRIAGRPVAFDADMKMIVDTEMLYRGKKRVETFNDLTEDCKNGIGRC